MARLAVVPNTQDRVGCSALRISFCFERRGAQDPQRFIYQDTATAADEERDLTKLTRNLQPRVSPVDSFGLARANRGAFCACVNRSSANALPSPIASYTTVLTQTIETPSSPRGEV